MNATTSLPCAGQELQEKDWGFYIFAAGVCAFFAAYGIGANDVANCFATSVGSKALTVKQAVVIASVCEFFGALLMGCLLYTSPSPRDRG